MPSCSRYERSTMRRAIRQLPHRLSTADRRSTPLITGTPAAQEARQIAAEHIGKDAHAIRRQVRLVDGSELRQPFVVGVVDRRDARARSESIETQVGRQGLF